MKKETPKKKESSKKIPTPKKKSTPKKGKKAASIESDEDDEVNIIDEASDEEPVSHCHPFMVNTLRHTHKEYNKKCLSALCRIHSKVATIFFFCCLVTGILHFDWLVNCVLEECQLGLRREFSSL